MASHASPTDAPPAQFSPRAGAALVGNELTAQAASSFADDGEVSTADPAVHSNANFAADGLKKRVEGMGFKVGDDDTVILKWPNSGACWVRTVDGDYVPSDSTLAFNELARHQPQVSLFAKTEKGKDRPLEFKELLQRHGRRVDHLYYSYLDNQTRFEPNATGGGDLIMACCPLDERIAPEFSPEVDTWLRKLAGRRIDVLLDWLATIHLLDRPTAALYLQGPQGCGKGLLVVGVARLWGHGVTDYNDIIVSPWSSALKDSPVAHLDEGAAESRDGSSRFRHLVGDSRHALTEKFRPTGTLLGCPRVMITANNADALKLRENLTPEDEEAIGRRVLHVDVCADAREYLEQLGGRTATATWVEDTQGRAGALPRHVAWLAQSREVKAGSRFLVEGEIGAWLRTAGLRGGLQQDVLIAIARAASGGEDHLRPDEWSVLYRPGEALVNPERLLCNWKALTLSQREPNLKTLGTAIKILQHAESRPRQGSNDRVRFRHIDAVKVVEVAEALGVGDLDRIRSAFAMTQGQTVLHPLAGGAGSTL